MFGMLSWYDLGSRNLTTTFHPGTNNMNMTQIFTRMTNSRPTLMPLQLYQKRVNM